MGKLVRDNTRTILFDRQCCIIRQWPANPSFVEVIQPDPVSRKADMANERRWGFAQA